MGWHIGEFGAFKLVWIRTVNGWRLREQYSKKKGILGDILAYPVGKPYRAWQHKFILLSSLVCCIVIAIILVWGSWISTGHSDPVQAWLGRGMLVLVLFLPIGDGARWAELKANPKSGEAVLMWDRLVCEWNAGKRPRDWNVGLLDSIGKSRAEGLLQPFTEYMRAYYLWDKGELELADAQFDYAHELSPPNALNVERAFFKRIVMGDESELSYPHIDRNLKKTDAFYAYENGEFESAIGIAEKWINKYLSEPKFNTPAQDFDRENLSLLIARSQAKLRETHSG